MNNDVRFSNYIDEVHIFQAIEKGDMNVGMHVYVELSSNIPTEIKDKICIYEPVTVKSPAELSSKLEIMAESLSEKMRYPLLHFDFHADRNEGLYFPESRSYLSWKIFSEYCRKINHACANNLTVVMGACWGFYALLPLDFKFRSPYSVLLGFDKCMSNQEVEDDLLDFYKVFIKTANLSSALHESSSHFQEFVAEHFLIQNLIRYHVQNCSKKDIQERTDSILSQSALLNPNVKENLTWLRKLVKNGVKKMDRDTVQEHYDRFLCASDPRNAKRYDMSLWEELLEASQGTAKDRKFMSIKIARE